jgi:hypothetical protein
MNAYWVTGRRDDAVRIAHELVGGMGQDRYGYLPQIVKVFIESGDVVSARNSYEKLATRRIDDAFEAWTGALVLSASGVPKGEAIKSIRQAIRTNSRVPHDLRANEFSPWSWLRILREEPGGEYEADLIANLHGSCWKTVDGWKDMLAAAEAQVQGESMNTEPLTLH